MHKSKNRYMIAGLFAFTCMVAFIAPVMAHHSFAMYDQTKTVTWTSVATRFVGQDNHAEIQFVPLGPDVKPMRDADKKLISWGVEMAGDAAVALQGITAASFPAGTI